MYSTTEPRVTETEAPAVSNEFLPPNPTAAFVYNPASAGAAHAKEKLQDLINRGLITWDNVCETVAGGIDANRDDLREHLLKGIKDKTTGKVTPYDVVVNMGGDGSGELIANIIAEIIAEDKDLRQIPILEAGNGGANDGRLSDFPDGEPKLDNLGGLQIVERRPILVEAILPSGETTKHRAPRYKSLGFTALAADRINDTARRAWRRRVGVKLGQRALLAATVFGSLFKDSALKIVEGGKERTVREFAVLNNRHMAGFNLGDDNGQGDELQILESSSKVGFMAKALLHKWQSRPLVEMVVSPKRGGRHRPVYSQNGGEGVLYPPGTRLRLTKDAPLLYAVGHLTAA